MLRPPSNQQIKELPQAFACTPANTFNTTASIQSISARGYVLA